MKCAIIGTTKIAEVHAKHLIENGIKEITFISRSAKKRKKNILNVEKQISKKTIFFQSNLRILKKKYFDIICICSSTDVHDIHLKASLKNKAIIIVEKPIISLLKFKNKYLNFLKKIYQKKNKIVVCYPYIHLAKQFKRFFSSSKKIKNIKFEFQSGGKSKFKDICINLMPHALTFLHTFLKGGFLKSKIKKNVILIKKDLWQVQFDFNKISINIIFKVDFKKKTSLKVSINDLTFIRRTLKKNNKFINYIQNFKSHKKEIIDNPMGEFYKDFF